MSEDLPVALLGSKRVGLTLLRLLLDTPAIRVTGVASPDDSADGRSELTAMRDLCDSRSVPFVADQRRSVYDDLLVARPRLVLVAGWYRLVPTEVLQSVPQGFVGVHFSTLPHYRGSSPVVWALLNGEETVGYWLFRLSAGMDEGLLAGQGEVPAEDRYVGDVLADLEAASTTHLARIARPLAEGSHPLVDQPPLRPSYAGARRPSDGLIRWQSDALHLARFVRAQSSPYPGAFTHVNDKTIRIWRARHENTCEYHGEPGQLVRLHDDGPVIACGGGTGLLLEQYTVEDSDGKPAEIRLGLGSLRLGGVPAVSKDKVPPPSGSAEPHESTGSN